MDKLFIGAPVTLDPKIHEIAATVSDGEWKQDHPHLTFFYAGNEVTDDDAAKLREIWWAAFSGLSPEDLDFTVTKEYELFGDDKNILAIKCSVSGALVEAVAAARESSYRVESVTKPEKEYSFNPHISLVNSHALPDAKLTADIEDFGKFRIDEVFLWGDKYAPRFTFKP